MPCNNNGSNPPGPPGPGPAPPSPPPADAFELEHDVQCLSSDLTLGPCHATAASKVWYTEKDGAVADAIKTSGSCLKVFESVGEDIHSHVRECAQWHELHVGVCRQDNNSFSFSLGRLVSTLCHCSFLC